MACGRYSYILNFMMLLASIFQGLQFSCVCKWPIGKMLLYFSYNNKVMPITITFSYVQPWPTYSYFANWLSQISNWRVSMIALSTYTAFKKMDWWYKMIKIKVQGHSTYRLHTCHISSVLCTGEVVRGTSFHVSSRFIFMLNNVV